MLNVGISRHDLYVTVGWFERNGTTRYLDSLSSARLHNAKLLLLPRPVGGANLTILNRPTSFRPFETQTSPDFRSPLRYCLSASACACAWIKITCYSVIFFFYHLLAKIAIFGDLQ